MEALSNRRNILIALACVGGLGAAEILTPRRRLSLLGKRKLEDVLPRDLPGWISHDASDLVAPRQEGSLASRIYGQTVGRVYRHEATGFETMMLAAYGETQSRDLQLHRPESCYPAVGFAIKASAEVQTPLGGAAQLPTRRLVAEAPGRRESIVYWSRLGEYLPRGGMEQRVAVLRTAFSGYLADGLLMRVSAVGEPQKAFGQIDGFIADLLKATAPQARPALIGTRLSQAMTA
jgi:EpsI family protein